MDDENSDGKRRDKFSRHKDGSDDEASEKDDSEKKRKASKDSNGDSIKEEKTSEDQVHISSNSPTHTVLQFNWSIDLRTYNWHLMNECCLYGLLLMIFTD